MSFYNKALLYDTNLPLLNLIGSTGSAVFLVLSFIVGRLLDAGYFRYLTVAGWALTTLGMFTLSQTSKIAETADGLRHVGDYGAIWVTHGLTPGLGMACLFVSSSQSQSRPDSRTKTRY